MHCSLTLYTEPKRPLINPQFDLFAYLDTELPSTVLFPAKVVDRLNLMLPEKCRQADKFSNDMWEFICWQVEEKGYVVVKSIDSDWLYWSVKADKYTLLDMVKILS